MLNTWFVYIVECADQSLYTGVTANLPRRIKEHQYGKSSQFIQKHTFLRLLYTEQFNNKYDAYKREKQIKGFSRQKKLALIKTKSINENYLCL